MLITSLTMLFNREVLAPASDTEMTFIYTDLVSKLISYRSPRPLCLMKGLKEENSGSRRRILAKTGEF